MKSVKFVDVDILDSLEQIMELHTLHYKEDFNLDKELISKLAVSDNPEDRQLLWMSRPCGTYTLRERETYLQGSFENNVWQFYLEQTKDPILAYAISLDGMQDGTVTGTIFPLDYAGHAARVKELTCSIEKVTVTFADGAAVTLPYKNRIHQLHEFTAKHGNPKTMYYLPESEAELSTILKRERFKRAYHAVPGDIEKYISALRRQTTLGRLREAKAGVTTQKLKSHKKERER